MNKKVKRGFEELKSNVVFDSILAGIMGVTSFMIYAVIDFRSGFKSED